MTYFLTDKLLQHSMQFVPHLIYVLLNTVLSVVPLLLQFVLHDHLPLITQTTTNVKRALITPPLEVSVD